MKKEGITHRTAKDILEKLRTIVIDFQNARETLGQSGYGVMEIITKNEKLAVEKAVPGKLCSV